MKIEKVVSQLEEFGKRLTERAFGAFKWIEKFQAKDSAGEVMDLAEEVSYEDLFSLFNVPDLMWSMDIERSRDNLPNLSYSFLRMSRQRDTSIRRAI